MIRQHALNHFLLSNSKLYGLGMEVLMQAGYE